MVAFVLTLIYIAVSLLSPNIFPDEVKAIHVDMVLGALLILSLLPSLSKAKLGSIPDSYFILGIVLSGCTSILMVGWLSRVLSVFIDFLPVAFSFFFIVVTCRSIQRLKILAAVMAGVGLFIFSQGAIADHAGDISSPYMFVENLTTGAIYRYKGQGVVSDPNDFAQLLTMTIPLLWIRWKKGSFFTNSLFTLVPAALMTLGVYFTHSRGGAIALVAVVLFGLKDKLGVVKSSVLATVLLIGMLALNITGGRGINEDDGGRVAAWITGLQVFKAHPLFGIGVGNFGEYNETGATAHNSYVLVLAEAGLFGYFFWMGAIVSGWSGLSRVIRLNRGASTEEQPAEAGPAGVWQRQPLVLPATWAHPAAAGTVAPSLMMRTMTAPAPAGGSLPGRFRLQEEELAGEVGSPERLVSTAKAVRVSVFGLLTSSFFLSRSYSMVFFIALGFAASLKLMDLKVHPFSAEEKKTLIQRIFAVMALSVLGLYLFVRFKGLH